jgi:ABC-type multidrug transport system fused ATPase/permease subunit
MHVKCVLFLRKQVLLSVMGSHPDWDWKTHGSQVDLYCKNVAYILGVWLTRAGGLAALGQALIPYYTGIILDQATMDPDRHAFRATVVKLMTVSLGCAVFTGVRGGLFTLAMARLNVRFRQRLYASLLNQEIAFFDSTKTGAVISLPPHVLCMCWFLC